MDYGQACMLITFCSIRIYYVYYWQACMLITFWCLEIWTLFVDNVCVVLWCVVKYIDGCKNWVLAQEYLYFYDLMYDSSHLYLKYFLIYIRSQMNHLDAWLFGIHFKVVYCVSKKVDECITLIHFINKKWCSLWFRSNKILNSIYTTCKQEVVTLLKLA